MAYPIPVRSVLRRKSYTAASKPNALTTGKSLIQTPNSAQSPWWSMKSEIKWCSHSFLSLPPMQTFVFCHRKGRSHRGLSYAASPSVCPLRRGHLAPSFFLGTSRKANYSFCNTASLIASITAYGCNPPGYCCICTERTWTPLGVAPGENITDNGNPLLSPPQPSHRTLGPPPSHLQL